MFMVVFAVQGSGILEKAIKRIAELYTMRKKHGANRLKNEARCRGQTPNRSSMIWKNDCTHSD